MSTFRLHPEHVSKLQDILAVQEADKIAEEAALALVKCRYRGCNEDGKYFLHRVLKDGSIQTGLFCDRHETRFGEQNLKRIAHDVGRKVETLIDEEGEFRGIDNLQELLVV